MTNQPETDIFIRILNKVEQLDGIAADVREIKNVQREHSKRFDQIDQRFAEMDKRFDRMDLGVAQLGSSEKSLETTSLLAPATKQWSYPSPPPNSPWAAIEARVAQRKCQDDDA